MKRWLIAVAVLACAGGAVFLFKCCVGDVRNDVSKLEGEVLDTLSSRGMTDDEIVSREEEFWKKGFTKGKTVADTFNAGKDFFSEGLEKDLRKAARSVRGVRLDKKVLKKDKDGRSTEQYDFSRGRDNLLSLSIKSVAIAPVKKATSAVNPSGKTEAEAGAPKPKVAIVLDDFGYTKKNLAALKAAGIPITMAILPNTPYSKAAVDFASANGMEVILHLPMEPKNAKEKLEKDTVKVAMKASEIREIIGRDLDTMPSAKGISNHMGSKATADGTVMRVLFEDLGKRKMYFLDSMTTDEPVSKKVAEELGVPMARRDIFIDHINDETYVKNQMEKIMKMAMGGDDVVAIGHDRSITVKVLQEYAPRMKKSGIRFVLLSEMITGKD
jgi:hypothetical protein